MWGASRSSLSELSDWLDAQRGAEGLAALPAELFSVADLLDREKTLRTALADSGQSADSRSELAASLLASRISPLALRTVQEAVRRRWSSDADLLLGIEALADQAAFMVADAAGDLDVDELVHRAAVLAQRLDESPCNFEPLFAAQRVAGDDLGWQLKGVGFGADQQGGGKRGQAPQRREGHRTFLGKTAKRFDMYGYNITSLFR